MFGNSRIGEEESRTEPYGLVFSASSLGDSSSFPFGRCCFVSRREILIYLSGSISGDTGTGGGLYPFFPVGLGMLVDSGVAPAEEASVEDVDDAALIAKICDNPTPPPPYLN